MNNRQIVSEMTNILKTVNRDDRISRRFILRLLQDSAQFLISQKYLDRTIQLETNLYTAIDCFQFEKVESKSCSNIEFRFCKTLMKSKCPLPELVFSRLGASIKEIVTIDGNYRFVFLDKGQYQRNRNRQYAIKDAVYVYLDVDRHLYIPDVEIRTVDLVILTTRPEEAEDCSECGKIKNTCKSKWDGEFICPQKLIEIVKEMTLQKLGMSRNIKNDENPNNFAGV